MKQFIVVTCLAFAVASCNNDDKTKATSEKTEAAAEVKLPIPLVEPYRNWQIVENNDNVVAALNSLKAFIDKDFTALAATLGDSVQIRLDGYSETLSRDSAVKMFAAQRPMYVDLAVSMHDYESVIAADKKDEYVTLWYKQTWKDEKGKADSMNVVDDCKMKNGKMIGLDEKIQRYPVKK